jgi:site-specific DNA recombinase
VALTGGRRPFGYDVDRVTIRPVEAGEIRAAAARVIAGESPSAIAADWNRRGLPSVTGAPWSSTTIRRLLRSGRIAGRREQDGRLASAAWPAIVDEETLARLRAILDPPMGDGTGPTNARSYLLSGLVMCGLCGARMTARPVSVNGRLYRRYHCVADRGGCNRCGIVAEPLEGLVVSQVIGRRNTPAVAAALAVLDGAAVPAAAGLPAEWPRLTFDQQRAVIDEVIEWVVIAGAKRGNNRFDADRVHIDWRA